jgi:flagellar motor switch protein FliN/FliY
MSDDINTPDDPNTDDNVAKDVNFDAIDEDGQVPFEAADDDDDMRVVTSKELEAVYEVPVKVAAVLGQASMQVNQLLKLGRGAVVELDRKVGEPIDIYVNNRLVARGEVVIVDERLGVTMTEIIKSNR